MLVNHENSNHSESNAIPISPLLDRLTPATGESERSAQKGRLIRISLYAVVVAVIISAIARLLVGLINLVTNLSFFGVPDFKFHSPAANHLGLWVIFVPAIGGLIVGLMALYGSKAIRGHGIPEAMEQILVNESNIKPSITFLKPVSSAIAIGTGGPFGAEGPIIATGGALGSTFGQLLKITANERKILLAAGATAGMSAIFGTPIAAVFLAIELLLFEFSPRSILPVALACITGAAGHHLLFEPGAVFPMPQVALPGNTALATYSIIGVIIGFLSLGITRVVYLIEDAFEKLPIHWIYWPVVGGVAVGIIGYFAPHTLGVGYDNITGILSGRWPIHLIITLCLFKFLSWAIALGSGTSGGTLAPLLTIGGAAGAAVGSLILTLFPGSGINIPLAALVGMSAMFAGASRAYLTSIVFALEATMESHALLPLLGACTASYLISFFLMENTIMTEKIARRGVLTPDSFEPDVLQRISVAQIVKEEAVVINKDSTVAEIRDWSNSNQFNDSYLIAVDDASAFKGVLNLHDVYKSQNDDRLIEGLLKYPGVISIKNSDTLRKAVELMAKAETEVLPIIAGNGSEEVIGILTYKDIIKAYQMHAEKNESLQVKISLKRQHVKMLLRGKKLTGLNSDDQ